MANKKIYVIASIILSLFLLSTLVLGQNDISNWNVPKEPNTTYIPPTPSIWSPLYPYLLIVSLIFGISVIIFIVNLFFKNKPSWLRGGIVGLVINILFLSIDFIMRQTMISCYPVCFAPAFISYALADGIYWGQNTITALIIVSSIVFMIIGALIGGIIGKIREKK